MSFHHQTVMKSKTLETAEETEKLN